MLIKATTLKGYKLNSLNGEIGKVSEFFFDDRHWAIRYLVADTGNWLTGRQVLISPYALGTVNTKAQHIAIQLTKKQIEDSPSLDTDKPVSRQFEEAYYGYYGWSWYWSGPYMWGNYPYLVRDPEESRESPGIPTTRHQWSGVPDREQWRETSHGEKAWDPNLRSTHDVTNHRIQATDGEIGHVEDFVIDDETWAIRYLIINTRNWWPGKKVLISPRWIERVSWSDSKVFVNLTRETIKQSPDYTEDSLITRDYETRLHRHYNREGYWVDELIAKDHPQ